MATRVALTGQRDLRPLCLLLAVAATVLGGTWRPFGAAAAYAQESEPRTADAAPSGRSSRGVVPTRVLLDEGFELGDLEDPALTRIERIEEYLQAAWEPVLEGYPKFMTPSLERIPGNSTPRERRYLRYPVRSGDAAIRGPSFSLRPWMQLRVTADLQWSGVGAGAIHVGILYSDGSRVPFITGRGVDRSWTRLIGEAIVPAGVEFGRVEIWIEGDHTRNRGEHGIDNVRVEILPRLSLRSTKKVRRIDPGDDRPFVIESVGFPPGEYDLELVLRNSEGQELLRMDQHKFVRFDQQIQHRPRLRWAAQEMSRGIYSVELSIRSESGWSLEDRGSFVLAGRPRFEPGRDAGPFGLVVDPSDTLPRWFAVFGQGVDQLRYLVRTTSREVRPTMPSWILELGSHRRAMAVLPEHEWTSEAVQAVGVHRSSFPTWYWLGEVDDGETFFEALTNGATFLRTGRRVSAPQIMDSGSHRALVDLPSPGEDPRALASRRFGRASFDVWLNGANLEAGTTPGSDLAAALYNLAVHAPQAVFLDGARSLFVEDTARGDLIPTRALLAWEFVTTFLSGADFDRIERVVPAGRDAGAQLPVTVLSFVREGESYWVAIGDDGAAPLEVYGLGNDASRQIDAFDSVGDVVRYPIDDRGMAHVEVGRDPILLRGIDVPKLRTRDSITMTRVPSTADPSRVSLRLALTNHYPEPVRFGFDVRYPEGWVGGPELATRAIPSGETSEWRLDVQVPDWLGISVDNSLTGDLLLDFGGRIERVAVSEELPVSTTRLLVERVDEPEFSDDPSAVVLGEEATVRIENTSGERLRVSVYLEVDPDRRRRFPRHWLEPGESAKFSIPKAGLPRNSQLFFAAVIENDGEQVNRVFPL